MNKIWTGPTALALVAVVGSSAYAADLPVKAPVKASPVPYAQYNDILAANNQIILQAVGTRLDYAEYDDGRTQPAGTFADSEKGWVPGVGLKASAMGNWGVSNLYVAAEASWSKGSTGYFESAAFGGPLNLTHNAELVDAAFRLGKGFAITPNFMITPFAEFGFHHWNRDTSPQNGETYQHEYAGGGLLLQYAPVQRLVLSASGMVGGTIDPQISIAANPGINAAINDLGLGTALTWRVGGSVDYAITQHFHIGGSIDYTEFKYGASATVLPVGIYEPNSTSQVLVGKIGIGYAWGGAEAVAAKY